MPLTVAYLQKARATLVAAMAFNVHANTVYNRAKLVEIEVRLARLTSQP